ncbi:MAG TPA: CPBP family intramembrane glutamic endopeptidase [Blastocatellia bacterium]|jgi:membrane protease YdiL (CAAX protease family)|nr:CPBP family intramembrane glutamic endopeptidase [Blastocatellia bacterium]
MKEDQVNDRALDAGAQADSANISSALALALFLASFFVAWSLRATVFYFIDEGIQSSLSKSIYSNAIKFALWVIPALAYVAFVKKRGPLGYLRISTPFEAKKLLYSGLAIALYFAGVVAFERFSSGRTLAPLFASSAREWLLVLLGVAVSPVSEEILFRGLILRELGERTGFWRANLLTSILFVSIHWPHWLWATGFKTWMVIASATMFILSLFLGYLVRLSGSIWPSVAAHILNNFVASFLRV